MDELLTPVSTTYLKAKKEPEPFLTEVKSTKRIAEVETSRTISSADEALDALKNQPDYDTLITTLKFLNNDESTSTSFSVQLPRPKSAAIVHTLVSEIALNYWTLLLEGSVDESQKEGSRSRDAELFLQCLRSVTGLNAIIAQLRALIQESRLGGKDSKRPDISLNLTTLINLLASVLEDDTSVRTIWKLSVGSSHNEAVKKVQSQQLISALTNGRLVSIAAEALALVERGSVRHEGQWVADGLKYSKWMGQIIATWAKLFPTEDESKFCSDLFQRSMSLGYSETLIKIVIDELVLTKGVHPFTFTNIAFQTPQSSKKILHILLNHLAEKFLNRLNLNDTQPNETIAATAEAIKEVVGGDEVRKNHLINWCTSSSGAGLGDGIGIRRAVMAVLAEDRDAITAVLEKSLSQFGDELYIRHAAMLQQDVHTQILLLSAGYVYKQSSFKLAMLLRSGPYLSTISNRISATQMRARFLGMVVGESLSKLIDKDKKLSFNMEEMDTEEAQYLKNLTEVSDRVGPMGPILSTEQPQPVSRPTKSPANISKTQVSQKQKKPTPKPAIAIIKPKAIIQEIDSSGDEDEDDLVPYAKESDPEDSDDDPTLVQRNKLKPPVYIRDLIKFLRDSESYDKQKLALQTAPVLIRRKANYGTEVSSHADELAGLLVGVQDNFELDNFADLKLQSMIALIIAQPKVMAPWFAKTFFEGDYSLTQRTSVLIAVGLSARELAGFDVSQYQSASAFPSKRLPEKMEQLYLDSPNNQNALPSSSLKALPSNALDTITQSLTSSFLAPLAAEAADATTGPDVLKLQSFTARYKSTTKAKLRVRAIPNTTAALIATSFFSPLTAHFQLALRSSKPLILNHGLLSLYLQTLGIIIHAAGPSTLSLPQLTSELWDLLLGVRVHVLDDLGAMKGWLVAMASLLEVNGGDMRRLCETQGKEVVETREWVGGVFERTRGEDGGEENEVKMLAAGVLIKLGEAIEKYQALLMGDLLSFS